MFPRLEEPGNKALFLEAKLYRRNKNVKYFDTSGFVSTGQYYGMIFLILGLAYDVAKYMIMIFWC
jgi:hypothetical protein